MIDDLLKFLGQTILYGGGAAFIAYAFFRQLATKWIDTQFAQRLDELKHVQAKELQRLRIEIDSMLSGALKLQEKEFQYLPEAWQKLDEAFGLVRSLVAPYEEIPALNRMTIPQLREFLGTTDFNETHKEEIASASDPQEKYREIVFWYRLSKVRAAVFELQNVVARNGIFFPEQIKLKFIRIAELLLSAVISKQVGHEAKDFKLQHEGWAKIRGEVEPLYGEIEADIHRRLRSHSKGSL